MNAICEIKQTEITRDDLAACISDNVGEPGWIETSRKVDRIYRLASKADVDFVESLLESLLDYIGKGSLPFKDYSPEHRKSFYMYFLSRLLNSFTDQFFLSCLLACLTAIVDPDSEPVERDKVVEDGAAYAIEEVTFFMSKKQKRSLWAALKIVGKVPTVNF